MITAWLNNSPQTNYVSSDIKGLIDLRKRLLYNQLIGYININSRKEKVIPDDDQPGRGGVSVWLSQTHMTENLYITS